MKPLRWVRFAAALVAAWIAAAPVLAHNQPPPIELWGDFLPETQTCLRRISAGAHACFDTVLGIEMRCRDAEARGEPCDRDAADAAIAAADGDLRATLSDACQEGQLTTLSYIGFFDAGADLTKACVTQAQNAIAAIYAPARAATSPPAAASCMAASAAYGRKVMWYALQREVPVMERIATRLLETDAKQAAILNVERELSADRARWIDGVLAACPSFEAVYRRTADSFLRTLKQRVDCVLSLTYVHSSVSCALQICGNAVTEGSEACDDGNTDDSDGCRSDCTLGP
jgi:cysteine-rich repeat protein